MTSATLLLARARRVLPRPRVGGRRRRPPRVVVRSAAKKADGTIEDRLSLLHPYVAGGAAFMTAWVLGPFPGSLYTGIPSHDALVASLYDALHLAEVFGPSSLITKYNELGRLPALTHALPGAAWCVLSAWQLHPRSREVAGATWHRWGGRAMLLAAAALMWGYALIDANGLPADVHDFGGHAGGLADAIDARVNGPVPVNAVGLRGLAAWFVFTGVQTGETAREGAFSEHKKWAARHVAAGAWVAAQRPAYSALRAVAFAGGAVGLVDDASGAESLADAFYYASYATTIAYFAAAEWAVRGEDGSGSGSRGGET